MCVCVVGRVGQREEDTLTSSANALASASVWVTPMRLRKARYSMLWQAEQTCLYTWKPRRRLQEEGDKTEVTDPLPPLSPPASPPLPAVVEG